VTKREFDRSGIADERGLTLIELIVAVTILSVTLVGLAASARFAAREVAMGREDTHAWLAAQHQIETLMRAGFDDVGSGSTLVDDYTLTWTVTGTNPKKVLFLVEQKNARLETVRDTVVFYMADPEPGS
jgi:prepilin-type N-terminal cleavage/methylation domain-containing protein